MSLEIKKEFEEFHSMYKSNVEERGNNFLIYGGMGTGKTHIIQTCRKPIFIASFDPGGTTTLRKQLLDSKSGIYADTTFEQEAAKTPTAYKAWEQHIENFKKNKTFSRLGTYVIDSMTMWSEAMMNQLLKLKGRPGGTPQLQDYMVLINTTRDVLKELATEDCDVLVTGHIDIDKDEVSGKLFTTVMMVGKLKIRVPLLFDEIYVAHAKQTSKGIERTLQTAPDGVYSARTRLGSGGIFDDFEKPDIKYLLRKAGVNAEDKEF